MDIRNHSKDRKKPVMRNRLKTAVFIAVLVCIALMVFRYFGFVSKTVYEESVSHLTEVFHQSDNMLRELTEKNLTYLHMWGENLQNTSSEDEIRDYIKKAQEDAGFLEFFFLSADGNYKMPTGETGYLGLQENVEEEIRQGNDVIANASVPGKSQLLVFATPKVHGTYQGFEYDAIAIAYENSDIVDVLDISAFDGNAQSFVVHPNGRVVVDHSSETWGNVYNFFGVLREHSDMSEKEVNELSEKFKAGRTDAMLLDLDGRNYYLVYEKSDIQDWMFLGLVQADIVNASMNSLQRSTILLVGAVVLCIAALLISFIILIIDQFIKHLVMTSLIYRKTYSIISNFFYLTYVKNTGGAWSILSDNIIFLLIVSIICIIGLIIYLFKKNNISKLECIYYSLLFGGIIGNLIDRIFYKGVIDYIGFIFGNYYFPIFNIADICIVCGILLLLIDGWIGDENGIRSNKR